MPASRSARAITLAPRSWPSRPGLAITTRSFLDNGDFLVLAPHCAEHVAHFADGRVRPDGVENRRHQVAAARGRFAHPIEGAPHSVRVSRSLHLLELRKLRVPRPLIDIERLDMRLVLLHEVVDADDELVLAL